MEQRLLRQTISKNNEILTKRRLENRRWSRKRQIEQSRMAENATYKTQNIYRSISKKTGTFSQKYFSLIGSEKSLTKIFCSEFFHKGFVCVVFWFHSDKVEEPVAGSRIPSISTVSKKSKGVCNSRVLSSKKSRFKSLGYFKRRCCGRTLKNIRTWKLFIFNENLWQCYLTQKKILLKT